MVGLGMVRPQAQSALPEADGLVHLSLLGQQNADVEQRLDVVRLVLQSAPVAGDRLRTLALFRAHARQPEMPVGGRRLQPQLILIGRRCFRDLAQAQPRFAQQAPHRRLVRIGQQKLLIMVLGLG